MGFRGPDDATPADGEVQVTTFLGDVTGEVPQDGTEVVELRGTVGRLYTFVEQPFVAPSKSTVLVAWVEKGRTRSVSLRNIDDARRARDTVFRIANSLQRARS